MADSKKKRPAITPDEQYVDMLQQAQGSFKRGGTVPKTGTYRLHKGERVIPAKPAKRRR